MFLKVFACEPKRSPSCCQIAETSHCVLWYSCHTLTRQMVKIHQYLPAYLARVIPITLYTCICFVFKFHSGCGSPDASAVGPVTGHASAGQQGGHGLVEQEVVFDQQVLLGLGHTVEWVVLSLELTIQTGQGWKGENRGRCSESDNCTDRGA